ncbi:aconitase iron-sulfur domain-containing protein [Martensiomyces pterosporus]|nr:aconitase iron-sulfur domain-containing protein [Martensiomyces pterosporus]
MLRYSFNLEREANIIELAVRRVLDSDELNGWNIRSKDLGGSATTAEIGDAVVRAVTPYAEGLNVEDRAAPAALLLERPAGRRGMTLCEKIIAHHAIGLTAPGDIRPGDMVCVSVDWTIASELTWKGMDKTYNAMGRPGVNRNDRFWLAVDHTVDPRIMHQAKPKELVSTSAAFAEEAHLVDFYRPNYTILHTEFYRERAQPSQLVIGADSHTCSGGAVGALSIGMGAADVVMPLVTGETWLQVPETVEIRFINAPPFGIGGKDIILDVLRQLKRNTVAFERAVEYTGPGLKYMSCDARFACANMATEFGGIAGVFEADEITAAYIAKRKSPEYKKHSLYFRADPDAQYAESHVIDLSQVDSLVALHPSPDNVVHVDEVNMDLDGCFIGACTTAEEDLILAALVLEAGLKKGLVPVESGNRRVTPGSVPILAKLRRLGLIDVYQRAGFKIGAPGCSYCLGIAADVAGDGEVWLSSQNRNFKNRMGPGSIGNLASAATVAASSFAMKVTNPRDLLDLIDRSRYNKMLDVWMDKAEEIAVSEPNPVLAEARGETIASRDTDGAAASDAADAAGQPADSASLIAGKVQRFEDNIDTDAIIPAQFMPGVSDEDLGTHAFQYFRPEFREKVAQGYDIIVAGGGFGSGSSREEAPRALKGAHVKAVIAKSYAFIYQRNQPNMALLGIVLKDEKFYELAQEGAEVSIDLPSRKIYCGGHSFSFNLSTMEERLILGGGVTEMYKKYGNLLFRAAIAADPESVLQNAGACGKPVSCGDAEAQQQLAW